MFHLYEIVNKVHINTTNYKECFSQLKNLNLKQNFSLLSLFSVVELLLVIFIQF